MVIILLININFLKVWIPHPHKVVEPQTTLVITSAVTGTTPKWTKWAAKHHCEYDKCVFDDPTRSWCPAVIYTFVHLELPIGVRLHHVCVKRTHVVIAKEVGHVQAGMRTRIWLWETSVLRSMALGSWESFNIPQSALEPSEQTIAPENLYWASVIANNTASNLMPLFSVILPRLHHT